MFRFQEPSYLLWLLPVLLLVWVFREYVRWRQAQLNRLAAPALAERLVGKFSMKSHQKSTYVLMAVLALSVVALANPQWGTANEKVSRKGLDLIICLDISQSMWAADAAPNRISKAKTFIQRLIDKLNGDRLGLVVFAGNAFLELPLTTDYPAAKLFTKSLSPEITSAQGTAIDQAIETAMEAFDKSRLKSRAMVIISDGESHEGGAEEMAAKAAEAGIRIFTVGVGSTQGANIPLMENGTQRGFKTDKDGSMVVSKLNPEMLQAVAAKAKGSYLQLNNEIADVKKLLAELNKIERTTFDDSESQQFPSYFWLLLIPALALLVWDSFRKA